MNVLGRCVRNFEEIVGGTLLVAILAIGVYQVVGRYVFASPPAWTEELATILFAWCVFIGASLALKKREHFALDLLVELLPRAPRRLMRYAGLLLVAAALLIVIYFGAQLAWDNRLTRTPTLELPRTVSYLAVPFGGLLMLLRTAEQFWYLLRHGEFEEPPEDLPAGPSGSRA